MRIGKDFKFYYSVAGATTPTWVEVDIVRDSELSRTKETADGSARDAGEMIQNAIVSETVELTFDIRYEPTDTKFLALETAYDGSANIGIAVCDGDITTTGTKGWRGDMILTGFSQPQTLRDITFVSVTAIPAVSTFSAGAFTVNP